MLDEATADDLFWYSPVPVLAGRCSVDTDEAVAGGDPLGESAALRVVQHVTRRREPDRGRISAQPPRRENREVLGAIEREAQRHVDRLEGLDSRWYRSVAVTARSGEHEEWVPAMAGQPVPRWAGSAGSIFQPELFRSWID